MHATKSMVSFCFDTLVNRLNRASNNFCKTRMHIPETEVGGMFVTWKRRNGDLRGCIGSLATIPLSELRSYAIKAGFEENRFEPIQEAELTDLVGHVSILHSFEDCVSITDWKIGKHGLMVTFTAGNMNFRSTFLPEVAEEQKWTHEATILHAVKKSGFRGSFEQIKRHIRVTRYQSSIESMTYQEYLLTLN
jgi:uncharacterized protein (TIGR00296 family)